MIESIPTNLKRSNFFIVILLHAQEEQEISKSCAQAGDLLANFWCSSSSSKGLVRTAIKVSSLEKDILKKSAAFGEITSPTQ